MRFGSELLLSKERCVFGLLQVGGPLLALTGPGRVGHPHLSLLAMTAPTTWVQARRESPK